MPYFAAKLVIHIRFKPNPFTFKKETKTKLLETLNILDYSRSLPKQEKQLLEYFHELIMNNTVGVYCKLSYGVPYYYKNRRICFLWPASMPYSNVEEGIRLGFCYGHLLSNEQQFFPETHHKVIRTRDFIKINEIDPLVIRQIINEAILIDDTHNISK